MSPIPLGILAASGAAGAVSSYELIESNILASNSATVTFSSLDTIAADYKHLQIRAVARSNRADFQDGFAVRLNGVTSSVYASHYLYRDNISGGAFAVTSANRISRSSTFDMYAANETAGRFGVAVFDILDFASASKTTTLRYFSGAGAGTQIQSVNFASGFNPNDTTALTSITFLSHSGSDLVTGSRFSLYGIRG